MKTIYLDHASTTRLEPKVLEKMMPYLTDTYGNANSVHAMGREAVNGLDEARNIVAKLLGAEFNEIYFTSGGTEGDNWAIDGFTKLRGDKNKLVTSKIEHQAMLSSIDNLAPLDIQVKKIGVDSKGFINLQELKNEVDGNTYLTAVMLANNEIGTIQPIKEIASYAKEKGSYVFTDAVQAMGAIDINVKDLGVDMLSFSAHKFGGPKGVGCVYIKNSTKLGNLIVGGHQERSRRGGTSNVAGAIGLAYALKFTRENLKKDSEYITNLRNYFIDKVLSLNVGATLNGDRDNRLPNNANITFNGVNGESLLYKLDLNGVCASLGAACSAGSIEPSYVLREIGLSGVKAKSSIRFTFGKENTFEEIDGVIKILSSILK